MTMQTELNWTRAATPEKLSEFEAAMFSTPKWISAKQVAFFIGFSGGEVGKRNVRRLAEMSSVIISGNDGYKHKLHATPEELSHFKARLRSQMERMAERLARL